MSLSHPGIRLTESALSMYSSVTVETSLKRLFPSFSANIGPRSGPGSGKKASYGSGKQTLRLRANGPAQVEEVDTCRTQAEEKINSLLESFMGINDSELGESRPLYVPAARGEGRGVLVNCVPAAWENGVLVICVPAAWEVEAY